MIPRMDNNYSINNVKKRKSTDLLEQQNHEASQDQTLWYYSSNYFEYFGTAIL